MIGVSNFRVWPFMKHHRDSLKNKMKCKRDFFLRHRSQSVSNGIHQPPKHVPESSHDDEMPPNGWQKGNQTTFWCRLWKPLGPELVPRMLPIASRTAFWMIFGCVCWWCWRYGGATEWRIEEHVIQWNKWSRTLELLKLVVLRCWDFKILRES
jgi:hypothetical protein